MGTVYTRPCKCSIHQLSEVYNCRKCKLLSKVCLMCFYERHCHKDLLLDEKDRNFMWPEESLIDLKLDTIKASSSIPGLFPCEGRPNSVSEVQNDPPNVIILPWLASNDQEPESAEYTYNYNRHINTGTPLLLTDFSQSSADVLGDSQSSCQIVPNAIINVSSNAYQQTSSQLEDNSPGFFSGTAHGVHSRTGVKRKDIALDESMSAKRSRPTLPIDPKSSEYASKTSRLWAHYSTSKSFPVKEFKSNQQLQQEIPISPSVGSRRTAPIPSPSKSYKSLEPKSINKAVTQLEGFEDNLDVQISSSRAQPSLTIGTTGSESDLSSVIYPEPEMTTRLTRTLKRTPNVIWWDFYAHLIEWGESHADYNVPEGTFITLEDNKREDLGLWLKKQKGYLNKMIDEKFDALSQLAESGRLWTTDTSGGNETVGSNEPLSVKPSKKQMTKSEIKSNLQESSKVHNEKGSTMSSKELLQAPRRTVGAIESYEASSEPMVMESTASHDEASENNVLTCTAFVYSSIENPNPNELQIGMGIIERSNQTSRDVKVLKCMLVPQDESNWLNTEFLKEEMEQEIEIDRGAIIAKHLQMKRVKHSANAKDQQQRYCLSENSKNRIKSTEVFQQIYLTAQSD